MIKESGSYTWLFICALGIYAMAFNLFYFIWIPTYLETGTSDFSILFQITMLFGTGAICNGIGAIIFRIDNWAAVLTSKSL